MSLTGFAGSTAQNSETESDLYNLIVSKLEEMEIKTPS